MKHTDFTQKWLGLQDSNKFLKIVCGFLLFVNFILVIGVLNTEKLVLLIPQGLSEQADIAQNKASEGYKKSWGMYAATLLGACRSGFVIPTIAWPLRIFGGNDSSVR